MLGETLSLSVLHSPTHASIPKGMIELRSNSGSMLSVTFDCRSRESSKGAPYASTNTLHFGRVEIGPIGHEGLTLTNLGTKSSGSQVISNLGSADFTVSVNRSGELNSHLVTRPHWPELEPGEQADFYIHFKATMDRFVDAELVIVSDTKKKLNIGLLANSAAPCVRFSPALSFPPTAVERELPFGLKAVEVKRLRWKIFS